MSLLSLFLAVSLSGCGGGGGTGALSLNNTTTTTTVTSTSPTVTALSPTSSTLTSGAVVTVTGTNFTSASKVTFGAVAASSYSVLSSTTISAIEPAGVGVVDLRVTTPNGTSALASADEFTYQLTGHTVVISGSLGISGSAAGAMSTPTGVAVGNDGSVYVVDSGNSRVDVFSSSGTYTREFPIVAGSTTSGWYGIALDSGGNVYVANANASEVVEYSSIGTLIQTFALPAGSAPEEIAVLTDGDLLADAYGTNDILEYGPSATSLGVFSSTAGAAGIATDANGLVYLCSAVIDKLNAAGTVITSFSPPSGQTTFSPEIALDTSGNIYAGDDANSVILKLSVTGTVLDSIPTSVPTTVRGIATGPNNTLYIPDQTNNRIIVYGP